MLEIRKVTQPIEPQACLPNISCAPSAICSPSLVCTPSLNCIPNTICPPHIMPIYKLASGTYKSPAPAGAGTILELRVDVDGRRPQSRVSGDLYLRWSWRGFWFTTYWRSFVVETLTITNGPTEKIITGPIKYYDDPANVNDSIEVRIPYALIASPAPDATVKFYTSGVLQNTYICPYTSASFRTVTLEIDRFEGTACPPTVNTHVDPYPADLPSEDMTIAECFEHAGISMTVNEDDVLNDPDEAGVDENWNEMELHDLMENHFDLFANTLQWNLYGAVVPWFGGVAHDTGYYGVMFDWGGWQIGDTYLRQGLAIAYNALIGVNGALYNTDAKKNRLILQTFVHEMGHNFNLPHTWQRTLHPDSASESFMNYPWGYTGGNGTESAFWSNFRWEFDDVELIWMRHADRRDVIFGGRDWIGNNLSIYTEPQFESENAPLALEVQAKDIFEYGEPVQVEIKLQNISSTPQPVVRRLAPEDGLIQVYVRRPNGEHVRYLPPVSRLIDLSPIQLAPGESLYEAATLSYGAKGLQFSEPGEYHIRAFYRAPNSGMAVSPSLRIRVAVPTGRENEELAHLLFDPAAAKFIYFGGSERNPRITAQLEEAAERYAKTSPATVRHIHAAFGAWQSAPAKRVESKKGRRVVTLRKANTDTAVRHLEAARELMIAKRDSAFNNTTYQRITRLLANCYERLGKTDQAKNVLDESQRYLKRRGTPSNVPEKD